MTAKQTCTELAVRSASRAPGLVQSLARTTISSCIASATSLPASSVRLGIMTQLLRGKEQHKHARLAIMRLRAFTHACYAGGAGGGSLRGSAPCGPSVLACFIHATESDLVQNTTAPGFASAHCKWYV